MDYSHDAAIDLHIHSTASDGSLAPSEIVTLACRLGLGAISITDHDVLSGSAEVLDMDLPPGLGFVAGLEISAMPPPTVAGSGSFHMLGYGISTADQRLNMTLLTLQDARQHRNSQILERLEQLGIDLPDAVLEASSGDVLAGEVLKGRPHIAAQMVKAGYVRTINEAFDRYLGIGGPAYVDKYRISSLDAIELISAAGGIPVLAHPFLYDTGDSGHMDRLIKALAAEGLRGIEAYYPDHSPEQRAMYTALAEKYGLLVTGGTDFHGALKPNISMGTGQGGFLVPFALYEKLLDAIRVNTIRA